MHFKDLSVCSYFSQPELPQLIAIGWLERGYEYATGDVTPELVPRLVELRVMRSSPWNRVFVGGHRCSLCGSADSFSMRNLLVPGPDVIYVTPEGIIHYVMSHRYRPPNEFVAAALAAPPAGSAEYYAALSRNGWPAEFVWHFPAG